VGAFRRQDTMGASRYRRHRSRLAAERHQQELEFGLGCSAAQPAGRGPLRAMTEVVFYHLLRKPLEQALPELLEKSYARGWRVIGQAASDERVDALDAHLWTYRDDAFLPHGTARESELAGQPILLTTADHNPNGATVRFLVDGVPLPENAAA